jgi:hypothetical protein
MRGGYSACFVTAVLTSVMWFWPHLLRSAPSASPSLHPPLILRKGITRYVLPALTLVALAAHPVLAAKTSPTSVDPLLGSIESFEVKTGQTLFEPREALANPQILEHMRTPKPVLPSRVMAPIV